MSWSPNFEENLSLSNGPRPTFEHYNQQNNYGLKTLRPKNVPLDVNEDVYDDQNDLSMLRADLKEELKLASYRRRLGVPNKQTERKKWNDQQEDNEDVEYEMLKIIRASGSEPEPSSSYRLNSKTTSKVAVPTDRLSVAGAKNLVLEKDHFKFENPYFRSKAESPEKEVIGNKTTKKEPRKKEPSKNEEDDADADTKYFKSFPTLNVGVAGEAYVSPAQLYLMKARRNR